MDQKQTRVDLNASVIMQNQNLRHRLEVPTCNHLNISSADISSGFMNTIKTEYTDKVWDSVRSSLFYAIYDCIEEHFKQRDYFR